MRRIIALEHISLDGVVQGPGGPKEDTSGGFALGGWSAPYGDEVLGTAVRRQLDSPFDLLLGRKTFDIWAAYWPSHGDIWPGANSANKFVASNTLASSDWQPSVFLSGDIAEKTSKIKAEEGPDLHVWGSANLIQTLMKHDLIDTFWLMIYPVVLGTGKRLFAEGTVPMAFKVTESTVTPNGVIIVNYERAGEIKTGSL